MISLYAVGTAKIEIGKYTMSLEEAKDAFLAVCEKHDLTPSESVKKKEGVPVKIEFEFEFRSEQLSALLGELANIEDMHGDPPNQYILIPDTGFAPNTYTKTGSYND